MKKLILFLASCVIFQFVIAQKVPIFHWADHLSYSSGVSVAEGNGKVYCATKSGIFTYNKDDNSMDRLSKINGLSDVEATVVSFNRTNNKAIICYESSNIDIIDNTNNITNISDIKRKNIVGDKHVYGVYMLNQYAYLACGFGIVVLDMNRMEVADTYYIGPNGNPIVVRDITSDGINFYAATNTGIYHAAMNSASLADFHSWSVLTGTGVTLPAGIYNTITAFRGKIYTNHSKYLMTYDPIHLNNAIINQDDVFTYDINTNAWANWDTIPGIRVVTLKAENNKLLYINSDAVYAFVPVPTKDTLVFYMGLPPSSYFDKYVYGVIASDGDVWTANDGNGLYGWNHMVGIESHYPNGPASEKTFGMSCSGGNMLVVPGGYDVSFHGLNRGGGIYAFKDNTWTNCKGAYPGVINIDTTLDWIKTIVDPTDENHGFASSWGRGVVELYNNVPIKHYDHSNSPLGAALNSYPRTDGLALDAGNNLWVGNSGAPNCLVKKSHSGAWTSIDFTSLIGSGGAIVGQILVDKNEQKWVVLGGKGLMVCAAGSYTTATNANTKLLTSTVGNGALPSQNIYCMAEDKNGEIWVGSDKGISVFYSPENVFAPGANFDSQQILLEQDGHVQILLLTELIQAIAVDDANRKWIATANSGVFLMSADGTQQIYHFDESNSPLFSNDVRTIAINHKTGEVYFGTAKGIIEFRGTATESNEDCSSLYAFPNPVKPEYDGPIALKGMMENSTIKITDVSGTLVYETKSEGGQALWYGKNFKGQRVSTGIYMAFCTNEDGSQKCVTKILFIN